MKVARILVVDDDPVNLDIISEFLEPEGYELAFAYDGQDALDRLKEATVQWDLVIADRMMPRLDGIGLLGAMNGDAALCRLPLIMQTAAASPEQVREGLTAGAYYYLTKPFEPEALCAIVRSALRDAEERDELLQAMAAQGKAMGLITRAEFSLRSPEEAHGLATLLAAACPEPGAAVLGLCELMVNAIEHGTLGFSYAEKRDLKLADRWEEALTERLAHPDHAELRVQVSMERDGEQLRFRVADPGLGFDWRRFLDFDPSRAFDPNGRGIALARQISFTHLHYEGCGNVAVATIAASTSAR